jgi:hypothetical protein
MAASPRFSNHVGASPPRVTLWWKGFRRGRSPCAARYAAARGGLVDTPHQRREMTLNAAGRVDRQYLPSPAERVRSQVPTHDASGAVEGRTLGHDEDLRAVRDLAALPLSTSRPPNNSATTGRGCSTHRTKAPNSRPFMLPRARRKACGERQFDMLDGPVGIRFPTKRPFDQILRIARGSGGHSRGNIGAVVPVRSEYSATGLR